MVLEKTDQVAMVMMVMVVMVVMMMAMVAIWFIVVMVIKLNIIMIFKKTDHQSRARPRHRPDCQRGSLNVYVYHDGCDDDDTDDDDDDDDGDDDGCGATLAHLYDELDIWSPQWKWGYLD